MAGSTADVGEAYPAWAVVEAMAPEVKAQAARGRVAAVGADLVTVATVVGTAARAEAMARAAMASATAQAVAAAARVAAAGKVADEHTSRSCRPPWQMGGS